MTQTVTCSKPTILVDCDQWPHFCLCWWYKNIMCLYQLWNHYQQNAEDNQRVCIKSLEPQHSNVSPQCYHAYMCFGDPTNSSTMVKFGRSPQFLNLPLSQHSWLGSECTSAYALCCQKTILGRVWCFGDFFIFGVFLGFYHRYEFIWAGFEPRETLNMPCWCIPGV